MQTRDSLIAFEERVKEAFLNQQIHAPVHLSGGDEDQVIAAFKDVHSQDWVFSNWRSHYHALLKGIPEDWLFQAILEGRSMYLMNREYRFMCSSIVGGILPIACGVALGIKRNGGSEKVHVCVGDMTEMTGIYSEFMDYSAGHDLPVHVIVADNGLSTNTPTRQVWGPYGMYVPEAVMQITRYNYSRKGPHVGVGQHVTFG